MYICSLNFGTCRSKLLCSIPYRCSGAQRRMSGAYNSLPIPHPRFIPTCHGPLWDLWSASRLHLQYHNAGGPRPHGSARHTPAASGNTTPGGRCTTGQYPPYSLAHAVLSSVKTGDISRHQTPKQGWLSEIFCHLPNYPAIRQDNMSPSWIFVSRMQLELLANRGVGDFRKGQNCLSSSAPFSFRTPSP